MSFFGYLICICVTINLATMSRSQTNSNSSVCYDRNLSVHEAHPALEAATNIPVEFESATEPIQEDKEMDGLIKYAGVFGGDGADYLQMLPDSGDLSAVPAPPHVRVKRTFK